MKKIFQLISEFFGMDDDENEEETEVSGIQEEENQKENEGMIELSEVIDFIRELEAYYTNDIFKRRTDYINNNSLSEDEAIYVRKQIQEYDFAIKSILEVKEKLIEKEQSCKELLRKASYSFFSELEAEQFAHIFKEVFGIVKELIGINIIPELEQVIKNRLTSYQVSWKLENETLPRNAKLHIIGRKGNIETYQFGDFQKEIITHKETKDLFPEQLAAIGNMKIQIEFKNPFVDIVWVRCVTVKRQQLEYLKRTTAFINDWENGSEGIIYDIVHYSEIEYYIRAMVQLLLPIKDYMVITIINPDISTLPFIKEAVEVDNLNKKVTVINKMSFLLPERTAYGENLQISYLSRKQSLQKLSFHSFSDFVKNFIK